MAITIDYGVTNRIFVPQADLTPLGGTLFELDVNAFRRTLRGIEDDEIGMIFPRTHDHFTEQTISGVTYQRVVIILPPYSVEFEDGQYSVLLSGANNNVGDVQDGILVQNQVQVLPQNSAGAIVVSTGVSGLTPQESADLASAVAKATDHHDFVFGPQDAIQSGVKGLERHWRTGEDPDVDPTFFEREAEDPTGDLDLEDRVTKLTPTKGP